jgi:hypothetical protein
VEDAETFTTTEIVAVVEDDGGGGGSMKFELPRTQSKGVEWRKCGEEQGDIAAHFYRARVRSGAMNFGMLQERIQFSSKILVYRAFLPISCRCSF